MAFLFKCCILTCRARRRRMYSGLFSSGILSTQSIRRRMRSASLRKIAELFASDHVEKSWSRPYVYSNVLNSASNWRGLQKSSFSNIVASPSTSSGLVLVRLATCCLYIGDPERLPVNGGRLPVNGGGSTRGFFTGSAPLGAGRLLMLDECGTDSYTRLLLIV